MCPTIRAMSFYFFITEHIPLFLSLAMPTLWGTENFTVAFISPLMVAGLVYGGIFRIHDNNLNRLGNSE
jgi:Na+-driven multidrug efflux pump